MEKNLEPVILNFFVVSTFRYKLKLTLAVLPGRIKGLNMHCLRHKETWVIEKSGAVKMFGLQNCVSCQRLVLALS